MFWAIRTSTSITIFLFAFDYSKHLLFYLFNLLIELFVIYFFYQILVNVESVCI